MHIFFLFLRFFIALLVLLFALATAMGASYMQTFVLILLAISILYWPGIVRQKAGKGWALASRLCFIAVLVAANFIFFRPGPKSSIYLSEDHRVALWRIYDEKITSWPADVEDVYVDTPYGKAHVLACGKTTNPPLMMIHAASMGAHSWAENLEPLRDRYRIYAIDNIGEGNKSQLVDAGVFPANEREIADLYARIAEALHIDRCPVFGASNGGFIAMSYAFYYPDKVSALALFGPMGLTPLKGSSIVMLSLATMYPFQWVRDQVMAWALGHDPAVRERYGDWFNSIMKGTIPSVAMPVPMTAAQKQAMNMPVVLFLGTRDLIVGDAEAAAVTARDFPDIRIEVLESGHLIAVEKAAEINKILSDFLFRDQNSNAVVE